MLAPLPPDLRACARRKVGPPPEGKTSKRALFALIGRLKVSNDGKDACVMRAICLYEDVARALLPADHRQPPAADCVVASKQERP